MVPLIFKISEIKRAKLVENLMELDPLELVGRPPEMMEFHYPLQAKVSAQYTVGDILVRGQISTTLSLRCARCLVNFEKSFQAEFQQAYAPEGDRIDVSTEVRETFLLELPFKFLCQEQCRGICAQCGQNKNLKNCRCQVVSFKPRQ